MSEHEEDPRAAYLARMKLMIMERWPGGGPDPRLDCLMMILARMFLTVGRGMRAENVTFDSLSPDDPRSLEILDVMEDIVRHVARPVSEVQH